MKWYGKIGFVKSVQTAPSVWTPEETIREYQGDVYRNSNQWSTNPDSTNDDFTVNHQISIIADPYVCENCRSIKWIEFMGARWKVKSFEVKPPRLVLTVGGVWNG